MEFNWNAKFWQTELHPQMKTIVTRKLHSFLPLECSLLYCWFMKRGAKRVKVVYDNGLWWAVVNALTEKHNGTYQEWRE